jgi:hypothetical protein
MQVIISATNWLNLSDLKLNYIFQKVGFFYILQSFSCSLQFYYFTLFQGPLLGGVSVLPEIFEYTHVS